MLSATMGPMFFGPDIHAMDMHGHDEPQAFQASTFAPQFFEPVMAGPPVWYGRLESPIPSLHHEDIWQMPEQFNPGPPTLEYENPALKHSALTSQPTQNSQSVSIASTKYVEEPVLVFHLVWEIPVSIGLGYDHPASTPASAPPQDLGPHVDPPVDVISSYFNHDPPPNHDQGLNRDPSGGRETEYYVRPVGGSLYGVLGTISTSTPAASHGLDLANIVSTGALDAAIQSYTSQLLLASSGVNNQSTITNTTKDLSATDESDEFVTLRDSATTGEQIASADVVAHQQAALEDVLRSLEDADSSASDLAVTSNAQDDSTGDDLHVQAADAAFGTAFDIAENDGGMVLLQTNGDANESPVNLARVAESRPDMFSAHLGVEASVGFYQAVDRGFEELSAAETLPTSTPAASSAQAKPVRRFSITTGGTSRKSAGVVAASALAGGLLWVAGRKQSEKREDDTRIKSRVAI